MNALILKKKPSSILHIGRSPDGTAYFNGLTDDLRIYNRTLTNSEVQAVYNLGQ